MWAAHSERPSNTTSTPVNVRPTARQVASQAARLRTERRNARILSTSLIDVRRY
jgi:hypothetical protein